MNEPPFVKYPSIDELEGDFNFELAEVFEKIDGSNCQVRTGAGRVFPGSRSHYLTPRMWDDPKNLTPEKKWMPQFKRWALSNPALYKLPEDVILFGEWTSPMKVEYPSEARNKFFLLDVALLNSQGKFERFHEYETGVNFCRELGLNGIGFMNLIHFGRVNRALVEKLLATKQEDQLAVDGMEGVVIKDYLTLPQTMAKCLARPYSEIAQSNLSPAERYITIPRVRKAYFALMEAHNLDPHNITSGRLEREVLSNISKERGVDADKRATRRTVQKYLEMIGK